MTFDKAQLQSLENLIRLPDVWAAIQAVLAEAKAQHAQSDSQWLTLTLDLDIYNGKLPSELKSSRITAFSADASTKIERHPNAVQLVRILEGQCNIRTRSRHNDEWDANPKFASAGNLYQRWSVVQPNVWHCPIPTDSGSWSVLAFHTVPADELIDETP